MAESDGSKIQAEAEKAKGNAALQSNNATLAIEHYTKAINFDGANHLYYSNRSAAYLKKNDANNALKDAEACLGLNPDFSKAYSRKGAALHALKRYNDSVKAFESGLVKFPEDAGLKAGLDSVKKERDGPFRRPGGAGAGAGMFGRGGGGDPMAGMFGPDLMAKIALDPKMRGYLNDADFVAKIKTLQSNPSSIGSMLSDKRMMEVFQLVLRQSGMDFKMPEDDDDDGDDDRESINRAPPAKKYNASPAASVATKKDHSHTNEKNVEDKEEQPGGGEENLSDPSPEDAKAHDNKKAAKSAKERGNSLYSKKDFEGALAAYDEAANLDSSNMTYLSNKAAVYFTQKKWDDSIEMCEKAVEVGKANRAPFEDRAKALVRCGKAYQKKGDYATAIDKLKAAQLEHHDKEAQRILKNWELEKKKADKLAYQDDDKAEEAKQKGNAHFRAQEWAEAVSEYEEAVKRAPKNAPMRNNLSAALCKIMDFNGAKREIDMALELDAKYVKAWARKGDIEILMKENHKAMESFKKGLEIDPTHKPCQDGLRKVATMINMGSANMSEDEKKERAEHALADPEIQSILTDPIIRQVLQDFGENPTAANEAMRDASVRKKIEKLIASGVVQTA